jgi:VCBS repeat-containing protein
MLPRMSFNLLGGPGLRISVTQTADGKLQVDASLLGSSLIGDLRGLFFHVADPSLLGALSFTGSAITAQQKASNAVGSLAPGVSMAGAATPFDVGLAFGTASTAGADDIRSTSFTIARTDGGSLGLDFLANVQFGAVFGSVGVAGSALRLGSVRALGTSPANANPVAAADSASLAQDGSIAISVLGNDTDSTNDVLSITGFTQPVKGSVLQSGKQLVFSTGDAFDSLGAGQTEAVAFRYTISDGRGGIATATVTVTVTGTNDGPTAIAQLGAVTEDEALSTASGNLLAGATDPDAGDSLVVAAVNGGAAALVQGTYGSLSWSAAGNYTYTLDNAREATSALGAKQEVEEVFSFDVSDGKGGTDTRTLTVTVAGVNDAPVAAGESYAIDENSTLQVAGPGLLANDADAEGDPLTAILVSGPAHGSVALNADGSFTYTPNADFFGTDSFSYKAYDGQLDSDAAKVSVAVAQVEEPPTEKATIGDQVWEDAGLRYFMRVEGVTQDWVELRSFNLGWERTGADGKGGVAGATAEDVVVQLGSTQSLARLVQYAAGVDVISKVEISAMAQAESGLRLVDAFRFDNVLVSEMLNTSGGNVLALDYEKFGHTHVTYDESGGQASRVSTGYDFDERGDAQSGGGIGDGGNGMPKDAKLDAVHENLSYYVRFDGIDETGWLELGAFSMGLAAEVDADGGAVGGQATPIEVSLTLGSSTALQRLMTRLADNKDVKGAEIEAYRTTLEGKEQLVEEFHFEGVQMTSIDRVNATSNQVTFDFGSYTHGYQIYDKSGADAGFVSEGFDFDSGNALEGVDPVADAVTGALIDQVSDADLRYFMRVEGVTNDWVELGTFSLGWDRVASTVAGDDTRPDATSDDVVVRLGSTQSLAKLVEYVATGKSIANVDISAMDMDKGSLRPVDTFRFEDVIVTGLQNDPGGNVLTFDYVSFGSAHVVYNQSSGVSGGDGRLTYYLGEDRPANKAFVPGEMPKDAKLDAVAGELDYYVRFDGIGAPNEWLHLGSFSMGLDIAPGSRELGLGGQVEPSGVTLELGASRALMELTTSLLAGSEIKSAEIEAYQTVSSVRQLVDEFRFDGVGITSIDSSGAVSNRLTFDFERYSHAHQLYDDVGEASFVAEGFDFVKDVAFDGPDPIADAGKAVTAAQVWPADVDLRYFMRLEGVTNDWVEVDSFSLGWNQLGGDGGSTRATADEVVLGLGSTQSLAKLVEYAAPGKHIAKVEISAMDEHQGGLRLVDSFRFDTVQVTTLENTSGGNRLAFDYGRFGHTHVLYDDSGRRIGDVDTGFDFAGSGPVGGAGGSGLPDKARLDAVAEDLDYFVRFDGIGAANEWLELGAFSMVLTAAPNASSGGTGTGLPPAQASDVTLVLGSSNALVQLTTSMLAGKEMRSAEIEAYRTVDGEKQLVDQFYFESVVVTSIGGADAVLNRLTFDFTRYSHGQLLHGEDGGVAGFVSEGFDFSTGTAFNGPEPNPDLI